MGDWALHTAAHRGDCRKVARLLADGAIVDKPNPFGSTPLLTLCCRGGGSAACAELLIAAKAAVDAVSNKRLTPLVAACIWMHADCAQLLIRAGADVNGARMPAINGMPLIEWAAHRVRRPVCQRQHADARVRARACRCSDGAVLAVLRAVRWSPANHLLFPRRAKARAVQLLLIGPHGCRAR